MIKYQSVAVEAVCVKSPHALISLHLLMTCAIQTALLSQEAADRLCIVEAQTTVKKLTLLHIRHIEGRVPSHLKPNDFVVGILHMPHHVQLIVLQPVAHGKIEMERILLQRLCRVVQGKDHLLITFGNQMEIHVACKAMARQRIVLAAHMIDTIPQATHNRKEYRRMTPPVFGIGLPQIFFTMCILHADKLCAVISDFHSDL